MTKMASVVIPLYNSSQFIDDTLKAVFECTYPDFEVVLVDDGSTDDTKGVLERNGWLERVRYIYKNNGGISSARNAGILAAEGHYISLLDHDDLPLPDKLTILAGYLETHPEYSMVYTPVAMFGEHSEDRKPSRQEWVKKKEGDLFEILYYQQHISPSSTLFIRDSMLKAGLFDESYKVCEDRDFFLRYAYMFKIGYVDAPLTRYSWRYDNTSVRWKDYYPDYEIRTLKQHYPLLREKNGKGAEAVYKKRMANALRHKAKVLERNKDYSSAARCYLEAFKLEPLRGKNISRFIRSIVFSLLR